MRSRPRIDLVVALPPDEVTARFRDTLAACSTCAGHVGRTELSVALNQDHRRWWSPWVSLEVRPAPEGASVRGRIGPQPQLWTAFVLIYSALVFAFLVGTTWGYVQWSLGHGTSGLVASLLALGGLAASCSVDLTGRHLGRRQIGLLHDLVARTLPEATPPEASS